MVGRVRPQAGAQERPGQRKTWFYPVSRETESVHCVSRGSRVGGALGGGLRQARGDQRGAKASGKCRQGGARRGRRKAFSSCVFGRYQEREGKARVGRGTSVRGAPGPQPHLVASGRYAHGVCGLWRQRER